VAAQTSPLVQDSNKKDSRVVCNSSEILSIDRMVACLGVAFIPGTLCAERFARFKLARVNPDLEHPLLQHYNRRNSVLGAARHPK
jgi:hypothetical protein